MQYSRHDGLHASSRVAATITAAAAPAASTGAPLDVVRRPLRPDVPRRCRRSPPPTPRSRRWPTRWPTRPPAPPATTPTSPRATRTWASSSTTTSPSTRSPASTGSTTPTPSTPSGRPASTSTRSTAAGQADSPYLYDQEDPAKLLVGRNTGKEDEPVDLPRNQQGRALIGDPRNDVHFIVSQLHLAFIRFHNAVVDHLRFQVEPSRALRRGPAASSPGTTSGSSSTTSCPPGRPRAARRGARHRTRGRARPEPGCVLHVAVAAVHAGGVLGRRLPVRPQQGARHLPHQRHARAAAHPHRHPGAQPAPAPGRVPPAAQGVDGAVEALLPARRRGAPAQPPDRHPAGRADAQAAAADRQRPPLPRPAQHAPGPGAPAAVRPGGGHRHGHVGARRRPAASPGRRRCGSTSCGRRRAWTGGLRLGPTGGRIVAEVLVGLLKGDPTSFLRLPPAWKPELPAAQPGRFTMADLLRFAGVAPG